VIAEGVWPPLAHADSQDTLDTLHMWTQIIGKTRTHVHVSADSRGVPLTESTGV